MAAASFPAFALSAFAFALALSAFAFSAAAFSAASLAALAFSAAAFFAASLLTFAFSAFAFSAAALSAASWIGPTVEIQKKSGVPKARGLPDEVTLKKKVSSHLFCFSANQNSFDQPRTSPPKFGNDLATRSGSTKSWQIRRASEPARRRRRPGEETARRPRRRR